MEKTDPSQLNVSVNEEGFPPDEEAPFNPEIVNMMQDTDEAARASFENEVVETMHRVKDVVKFGGCDLGGLLVFAHDPRYGKHYLFQDDLDQVPYSDLLCLKAQIDQIVEERQRKISISN